MIDIHTPPLFLLSNTSTEQNIVTYIALLQQGSGIIMRAYDILPEARIMFMRKIVCVCRSLDLCLLVAVRSRADLVLAELVGADGLHLPEGVARKQILSPILGWRRKKRRKILTISAHGLQALIYGKKLRADLILLSPVFQTSSHVRAVPLGPERFSLWCHKTQIPAVALGGIRATTIRKLKSASGIAVSFRFAHSFYL